MTCQPPKQESHRPSRVANVNDSGVHPHVCQARPGHPPAAWRSLCAEGEGHPDRSASVVMEVGPQHPAVASCASQSSNSGQEGLGPPIDGPRRQNEPDHSGSGNAVRAKPVKPACMSLKHLQCRWLGCRALYRCSGCSSPRQRQVPRLGEAREKKGLHFCLTALA